MSTANVSSGIVARVEGDYAWIDIVDGSGCGNCKSREGCGSGLLGLTAPSRQRRLFNTIGARPGDAVTLRVPEGGVVKAALLAYLFPLTLGIAGAAGGMWLGGNDAYALIGLLAGLAGSWLALHSMTRQREPWTQMELKPPVRPQVIQTRIYEET